MLVDFLLSTNIELPFKASYGASIPSINGGKNEQQWSNHLCGSYCFDLPSSNYFDFSVELGKVLAKDIRSILHERRSGKSSTLESNLPSSTRFLMDKYLNMEA